MAIPGLVCSTGALYGESTHIAPLTVTAAQLTPHMALSLRSAPVIYVGLLYLISRLMQMWSPAPCRNFTMAKAPRATLARTSRLRASARNDVSSILRNNCPVRLTGPEFLPFTPSELLVRLLFAEPISISDVHDAGSGLEVLEVSIVIKLYVVTVQVCIVLYTLPAADCCVFRPQKRASSAAHQQLRW